jgi:hypothetical protein
MGAGDGGVGTCDTCAASNSPCTQNGDCCDSLTCLSGAALDGGANDGGGQTCGQCVDYGNPCGVDNDCCSGTCDPYYLVCE